MADLRRLRACRGPPTPVPRGWHEDCFGHRRAAWRFTHPTKASPMRDHTPSQTCDLLLLVYCLFWLAAGLTGAERVALAAFAHAVEISRIAAPRLAPGDVLAIDNRRVLHGRTAIAGMTDRHLVRRWLATDA